MRFLARAALAAVGAMVGPQVASALTIGIAQYGQHPIYQAVADGFKGAIAEAGYRDIDFIERQVNFDAGRIPEMLGEIRAGRPSFVLAVTAPVAQAAKPLLAEESGTPVIFAAVSDPVLAGLTSEWDRAEGIVTGASDLLDMDAMLAFTRELLPDAKRFGFPYDPNDPNGVAQLKAVEEAAPEHGFEVVAAPVESPNDIPFGIASLNMKADVAYIGPSKLLVAAMPAISAAAQEIELPVISGTRTPVEQGLVGVAFEVDYEQVGASAGRIAVAHMRGAPITDLPPTRPGIDDHRALINRDQLESIGVSVPESLEDCECFVDAD